MPKKTVLALMIVMLAALESTAFAQKKPKTPTERSVSGVVTDVAGNPVPGAVVQLENMKTMQIRSFIAKEKGDYIFSGLGTDVDYSLKAEFSGHASATKTLSTFDSHPAPVINLQLK
jgi:hypothetical protein